MEASRERSRQPTEIPIKILACVWSVILASNVLITTIDPLVSVAKCFKKSIRSLDISSSLV